MTEKTKNDIQLIDLGLPSGILWADRNIGADAPEDYGDYFRFGETKPFTENSPSYIYDKIEGDIAGTDKDAATVILGEQFRMPTLKQVKELVTECSSEWTTLGGVNGFKVTGPNGNSIFLPAAGYRDIGTASFSVGWWGYYWSASPVIMYNRVYLYLNSHYGRAFGYSVRAVKG